VPDFKFAIWLEPLELAGISQRTLFVRAPDHIRTWVRDRYLPLVRDAARRGLYADASVEIVDEGWKAPDAQVEAGQDGSAGRGGRLIPKYTFDQFVIGRGNRFAHAAALAVAEQPGQAYNPLFIHGRPGLGKTHLLHAIGNFITLYGSGLRVRYATVEEFTSEFVTAARARDTTGFKQRFRDVDVLLLDDVQFLADKTRTREELFHTFNELHASGRQLVMTSDREPGELTAVEDRLGERFASGLVVGLDPPDLPVREAILAKRARTDDVTAAPELIHEIATRVTTSVRALEAALIQVVAHASLKGEQASPALARAVLHTLPVRRSEYEPPSAAAIIAASADQFGIPRDAVVARDRRPTVARARKVAMYLTRTLTERSLPEIGKDFGGRDHSTVLHAVRAVTTDLRRDPALAEAVENLERTLAPRR
jgi:chromosomal replication initiator protein